MPSATPLTNLILLAISRTYGRAACVQRINVMAAMLPVRGGMRLVKSARKGTPDVVGAIRSTDSDGNPTGIGRPVVIEVKTENDRMSPAQKLFRDAWILAGGVHVEGRSVEQVMAELAEKLGK
jgi:hypothetical protein